MHGISRMEKQLIQCNNNNNKNASSDAKCIVEFQSFIGNSNEFIVKELVIMDIRTNNVNYFLFKPPHSFRKLSDKAKRTNKWLMNNFHYIAWSEGFTEYSDLANILQHYCQQYSTIYTTGYKKARLIEKYTSGKVIDYIMSKNYIVYTGDGFCNSVNNDKHRITNCALLKTYRIFTLLTYRENKFLLC